MLDFRPDVYRQCVLYPTGEKSNQEIIKREREGEQRTADDAGHQERKRDVPIGLPSSRPEVAGSLFELWIESPETGTDRYQHERRDEHQLADHHSVKRRADADESKPDEQRNAEEEPRNRHRRDDERSVGTIEPEVVSDERDCPERSEYRCGDRHDTPDIEAAGYRLDYLLVRQ